MGITLVAYQLVVLFWLGWEKNMFFFNRNLCKQCSMLFGKSCFFNLFNLYL